MRFKTFRMYFQEFYRETDGRYLSKWIDTGITFRARNEREAARKAQKFCQEAQISGAFRVELEGGGE